MTKFIFILISCCSIAASNNLQQYNSEPLFSIGRVPESVKAVENFLIWYDKNYKMISRIKLVDNTVEENSNEVYYRIDFVQTERYLQALKSSSYISDKYINNWQAYFKKRDDKFIKLRQTDGPPSGFESDLILKTQEINETLKAINNIRFTAVEESDDNSVVEVDIVMNLRFLLTKYDGKWKIDEIVRI